MSTQISLKLSDKMIQASKEYIELKGYDCLQDFIRELIREKLFEQDNENIGGMFTYKASEKSLAKKWLSKKEDKEWQHLEKET